jgi:hypothetical protein
MNVKWYVETFDDGKSGVLAVFPDTRRGETVDVISQWEGSSTAHDVYLAERCKEVTAERAASLAPMFYARIVGVQS